MNAEQMQPDLVGMETKLVLWARGKITAADVQQWAKPRGWKVDLRQPDCGAELEAWFGYTRYVFTV
jgi:hypothetical protein